MCIFCQIVSKESPSWAVYQDNLVTAFFDYFPARKGHLLIVPNKHHENIFEIPEDTLAHLAKVSKKLALAYQKTLWVEHLNILQSNGKFSGQEVFHYHMHLIPKAENDSVKLWWECHENLRESYDELVGKIQGNLD